MEMRRILAFTITLMALLLGELLRPNGSTAAQLTGAVANLTLNFKTTQPEMQSSRAANYIK
jgi:hypothetical protein